MRATAPSLILLKIHRWDDFFLTLAGNYSRVAAADFKFLVDETRGEIDTHGFDKVSFTVQQFENLGLVTEPQRARGLTFANPVWYNSDYPLYAAYLKLPEYEYYWVMDYDVLINFPDCDDFFRLFKDNPADLLGTVIHQPGDGWIWRDAAARAFGDVWAIFWPIMRLSNRAVAYTLIKRLAAAHRYRVADREDERVWPFCEAWLVSELSASGKFSIADLNASTPCYDHPDGGYGLRPNRRHDLLKTAPDGLVYHPVLGDQDFLHKSFYWYVVQEPAPDFRRIRTFEAILAQCGERDENRTVCRALRGAMNGLIARFSAPPLAPPQLMGRNWWFGRTDGSTIAENLRFRPDGTIEATDDAAVTWILDDGGLALAGSGGAPLATFKQVGRSSAGGLTLRDRPDTATDAAQILDETMASG